MKTLLLSIIAATTLMSGCAELATIRQMASNELNAEIISEEVAIHRSRRGHEQTPLTDGGNERVEVRTGGLLEIAMMGKTEPRPVVRGKWE